MAWGLIFGIALGNNLDNAGVGIAYGIARIRLPFLSNLWIAVVTFLITASAVVFGDQVAHLLSPPVARMLSAVVLCGLGLWLLLPSLSNHKKREDTQKKPSMLAVLVDPQQADRDRSRQIDLQEATLLGMALSINNIGGGMSAGLVHLSILWTAFFSALISFLVLWLGGWAGRRLAATRLGDYAQVLAGVLLIVIGLRQFLPG